MEQVESDPKSLNQDSSTVISGIYYNNERYLEQSAITIIGVSCITNSLPQIKKDPPNIPILPGYPEDGLGYRWHSSSAPLDCVDKIRACMDNSDEGPFCIGIILDYQDGSSRSLGQWRWDFDIASLPVQQDAMISLLWDDKAGIVRAIDSLSSAQEETHGDDRRMNFHLNGRLIWWFCTSYNRILYVEPS